MPFPCQYNCVNIFYHSNNSSIKKVHTDVRKYLSGSDCKNYTNFGQFSLLLFFFSSILDRKREQPISNCLDFIYSSISCLLKFLKSRSTLVKGFPSIIDSWEQKNISARCQILISRHNFSK